MEQYKQEFIEFSVCIHFEGSKCRYSLYLCGLADFSV